MTDATTDTTAAETNVPAESIMVGGAEGESSVPSFRDESTESTVVFVVPGWHFDAAYEQVRKHFDFAKLRALLERRHPDCAALPDHRLWLQVKERFGCERLRIDTQEYGDESFFGVKFELTWRKITTAVVRAMTPEVTNQSRPGGVDFTYRSTAALDHETVTPLMFAQYDFDALRGTLPPAHAALSDEELWERVLPKVRRNFLYGGSSNVNWYRLYVDAVEVRKAILALPAVAARDADEAGFRRSWEDVLGQGTLVEVDGAPYTVTYADAAGGRAAELYERARTEFPDGARIKDLIDWLEDTLNREIWD